MRNVALAAIAFTCACKVPDPPAITSPWLDTFERANLGENYRPMSPVYKVVDGQLSARGAENRPLWLRKPLPDDVVIDVDTWSNSKEGDIKVELFGDGESYGVDSGEYTASGYVLVMGGWKNTKSILARHGEHGARLVSKRGSVRRGKRYHFRITRRGDTVTWYVDNMETPYLEYKDPDPLRGPRHRYFAINNWQSDTWFDNLRIAPLEN